MRAESLIRTMLQDEMNRRMAKNPRYSLRAYARDLGVSPSTISEVINGHHSLSLQRARDIAKRLKWNEHESAVFLQAVDDVSSGNRRSQSRKNTLKERFLLSVTCPKKSVRKLKKTVKAFEAELPLASSGELVKVSLYAQS